MNQASQYFSNALVTRLALKNDAIKRRLNIHHLSMNDYFCSKDTNVYLDYSSISTISISLRKRKKNEQYKQDIFIVYFFTFLFVLLLKR